MCRPESRLVLQPDFERILVKCGTAARDNAVLSDCPRTAKKWRTGLRSTTVALTVCLPVNADLFNHSRNLRSAVRLVMRASITRASRIKVGLQDTLYPEEAGTGAIARDYT